MEFSQAIAAVKMGRLLRRKIWAKDQFIYYVHGSEFVVNRAPLKGIFPEGTKINYISHIDICLGNNICSTWHPGQDDMTAIDWELVE